MTPSRLSNHSCKPLRVVAALRTVAGLACLAALAWQGTGFAQFAMGQLPSAALFAINPLGGKQGTQVKVVIQGDNLDDASALLFTHPGITAAVAMAEPNEFQEGPQKVANTFLVNIAADVPPGMYEVRFQGRYGLSNPRTFTVSDLVENVEAEPNNELKTAQEIPLNSVVGGTFEGPTFDWYVVPLEAGQRVVVQCLAWQLDTRGDPAIVVQDEAGNQLAANRDSLGLDALVDFTAPAAGKYYIRAFDSQYRGGDTSGYRLSVTNRPFIDFVYPPAGQPGVATAFTIYGRNLPGGVPADGYQIGGVPLQKLSVNLDVASLPANGADLGNLFEPPTSGQAKGMYRANGPTGSSNAFPIFHASQPVTLETEPNNDLATSQNIVVPCEVAGLFLPAQDRDSYIFAATKGQILWIDLLSQRLGRATDATLVLQSVKKAESGETQITDLRQEDDAAPNTTGVVFSLNTTDPAYRFEVPEDGNYRVIVSNLESAADPRDVYRLCIRPEQLDFSLVATEAYPVQQTAVGAPGLWSILLRKGGTDAINVVLNRKDGMDLPVEVRVEGLPEKVTAVPVIIPPGKSMGTIVLQAAADAAPFQGNVRVVGKAVINGAEVSHEAQYGTVVWPIGQNLPQMGLARLSSSLVLSVSATEQAAFSVVVGDKPLYEMSRAGVLTIPVKVTRNNGFAGAITINPADVPNNLQPQALTINPDQTEGALTLNINNNAAVGNCTIYLRADTQVTYALNPEAAAAAEAYRVKIEMLVAARQTMLNDSNNAKTTAEQQAATAAQVLKQAQDALAAAQKAMQDADAAQKQKAQAADEAVKAAAADPNNAGLAAAKDAAVKALAEADVALKTATDLVATSETALKDAQEKSTAAEELKTKTAQAATDAQSALQRAQAEFQRATNEANNQKNRANPQNRNVFDPAGIITLNVTDAPIKLSLGQPAITVKQGQKVDLPVTVERLYAFADALPVDGVPPSGVNGLSAPAVQVAAGQNAGVLSITAAADATVGTHEITIRAIPKFNGQDLTVIQKLTITVEAATN